MAPAAKPRPTACLALADGSVFYGKGFGAVGETVRVCATRVTSKGSLAAELVCKKVAFAAGGGWKLVRFGV